MSTLQRAYPYDVPWQTRWRQAWSGCAVMRANCRGASTS